MPNGEEHPLKQHGFTHIEGVDPIPIEVTPGALCFNLSLATTGVKQAQALIPRPLTVSKVILYSDDAPTGASLIVDINKNGTTIFTTQANRPEVAIDGHSAESEEPDVTAFAKGDRLSVDVDQVGSGVPGGDDLLVTVIC